MAQFLIFRGFAGDDGGKPDVGENQKKGGQTHGIGECSPACRPENPGRENNQNRAQKLAGGFSRQKPDGVFDYGLGNGGIAKEEVFNF